MYKKNLKFPFQLVKTFFNPSHPNHGQREKFKLNFCFHTSLWYLKKLRHHKEV